MGYAAGEVCGDRSTPKLRYAAEVGGRNGIGKNGKPHGKATAVGTRNYDIFTRKGGTQLQKPYMKDSATFPRYLQEIEPLCVEEHGWSNK